MKFNAIIHKIYYIKDFLFCDLIKCYEYMFYFTDKIAFLKQDII